MIIQEPQVPWMGSCTWWAGLEAQAAWSKATEELGFSP